MAKTLSATDISTLLAHSFAKGDAVNVTGATNAEPIVISATAHGLVTGDWVEIANVGGNTAANGLWVITKVGDDSFSLDDSTGDGSYTSGGTAVKITVTGFLKDKKPGDLKDLISALARRAYTRGTDAVRTVESNLETIFA